MDVIITVIGEFIWISSCAVVNCCLSSGLSAVVVFVSFLCGILASAFYKYTISRERMLFDDTNNKPVTTILSTKKRAIRSPSSSIETTNTYNTDSINPLSEIESSSDQNTSENNEQTSNDMIVYSTEDSEEEEIQRKQIKNIYQLLNDDKLTTTDFLDQLEMYGLQIDDETELELC